MTTPAPPLPQPPAPCFPDDRAGGARIPLGVPDNGKAFCLLLPGQSVDVILDIAPDQTAEPAQWWQPVQVSGDAVRVVDGGRRDGRTYARVHASTAGTVQLSSTRTSACPTPVPGQPPCFPWRFWRVEIQVRVLGPVANGGFEAGLAGWHGLGGFTTVDRPVRGGAAAARIGGVGSSSLQQAFAVPSGVDTLGFWYRMVCPDSVTDDQFTASLRDHTAGVTTSVVGPVCQTSSTYRRVTAPVAAGHTYTLILSNRDDLHERDLTYTYVDDVALRRS